MSSIDPKIFRRYKPKLNVCILKESSTGMLIIVGIESMKRVKNI